MKLIVGFIALFLVTRFIGGRELKHLTIFDFISAIVLTDLVGSMLYDKHVNVLSMVYSLIFWTLLNFAIDKTTLRSRKLRRFFDGTAKMVIFDNRIDKSILREHRIDLHELLSLLREKNVFSVREVRYAFLEPNGSLNVIKEESINRGRDVKDLRLPVSSIGALRAFRRVLCGIRRGGGVVRPGARRSMTRTAYTFMIHAENDSMPVKPWHTDERVVHLLRPEVRPNVGDQLVIQFLACGSGVTQTAAAQDLSSWTAAAVIADEPAPAP